MSEPIASVASAEVEEKEPNKMSNQAVRIAIASLAIIGVGLAGYLTYSFFADETAFCFASGGCETVQDSDYAKLAGVPVALLGLMTYVLILGSVFFRNDLGRLAGATFSLIGFGFSAYLTYREIFTIEAICQLCVASAVLLSLLAVFTVIRLVMETD